MENTRDLAPGSVIWIFFKTRTTASTFVEWLPYKGERLQRCDRSYLTWLNMSRGHSTVVFYLHCKIHIKRLNKTGIVSDLHRDVLPLVGTLSGEHIRDFWMWSGLSAYGALYGSPSIAEAVLLHDDSDALITETVSTGQYGPLTIKTHSDTRTQVTFRVYTYIYSIHFTDSFLLWFYLLSQRSSADGTWFWIQPSSWLILRLKWSVHDLLHQIQHCCIYRGLTGVHIMQSRIFLVFLRVASTK